MNERNGKLPLGWEQANLGELVYFAGRIGWRGLKAKEYTESGLLLLSVYNLNQGNNIDFTDVNHISWKRYEESPEIKIQENDILLAKDGGGIGKLGIVKDLPCEATINSSLLLIRTLETFDPKYLFYFMMGPELQYLAQERITGSATPHLFQKDIKNFVLFVAPLAEQRRIVAKIEALQERSRRAREALAELGPLLEQFQQSVLAAAFRGDLTADWRVAHPNVEPATELLHCIHAERRHRWEQADLAKYEAKGQKPTKNWRDKYEEPETVDDSDLPELPEGWKWSNFNEVSLIDGGLTKHEAKRSKATVFVPLISVSAVQHGYIDSSQVSKIGLLATDGDKGKLEKDDVLIVEGNGSLEHIGRAALWDGSIDSARHQNHLIRVRPVLLDPRFCLHWLGSPRGRTNLVAEATSAAGLYNLSLGKIGRVYIPIPPLDEQMEIVKQLDAVRIALRSIFALQRTTVNDIDSLDQSILAKAFRGELVPQDPNDEPASALLARIREQRAQQAEDTKGKKKTAIRQRRDKMGKKSSGLSSQHRPLVEVLTTKGKPMSPEQLLTESGYDGDSIEDFYFVLREEIAQGRIRENRSTESDVMLEAVK